MPPLVQLTPGMVFAGDYEVLRPLAQGGMGAVYVVRQQSTAKQRALKVLHPQSAVDGPSRERFVQEARVAAEIDSDHVTEVVGAGVDPATRHPRWWYVRCALCPSSPSRFLALAFALAAMGCVPDGWVAHPPGDAGAHDGSPVVDATGACTMEAGSACGCPSGRPRCGVGCFEGPRNLYRGEGDGRDGAGSQHATQSTAGFAEGRSGQAFAFGGDHTQQYLTLPPGVLDFGDGDFTVSFWFESTRHGNLLSKRASCWGGPVATGLDLRLTYAGGLLLELWSTTGFFMHRTSPGLNDGAWHHVAIVRDGATARFVVDGEVVSTSVLTGALRDPTNTPVYLGVGRCVSGAPGSNGNQDGSTWLDGRIDEVAFFSRALSETELLAVVQGRCAL